MAKEFIEREALRSTLDGLKLRYVQSDNLIGKTVTAVIEGFINLLERETAADVVEVRRGMWEMFVDEADYECGTCSLCGFTEYEAFGTGRVPNYCSNCGAKMDGERKEK